VENTAVVTHIRTKLIVAGIVLLAAVSYLASAGIKSGWVYFMEVDQFLSDPSHQESRVRLHGTVGVEQFASSSAGQMARFELLGKSNKKLVVNYRGSVPDQFAVGRNVVVEGSLGKDGTFQADILMTKCASKYEPGSPHAKAAAEKGS